jgi:hypothetical protein
MYIIEMVDDWDRTLYTWIVNCSEEEVSDFVNRMNYGLFDKLRKEVKSNTECYFYYRKCGVIDLPTEEEIKELIKPIDRDLSKIESISSTSITDEMLLNWDITKVTDMTNMFKDCK